MTEAEIQEIIRRPPLSVAELQLIVAALAHGLPKFPIAEIIKSRLMAIVEEELDPERREVRAAYRKAAKAGADGVEVGDDAEVSIGEDPGAYVMVWQWIDAGDAGVCRTCSARYEDGGDGFDGECPSCADKTDQEEEDAA